MAVSGDTVGVVWEDNRSGSPQCYLAMKPAAAATFQPEIRLSQGDCYEPVVIALGKGRLVAAWEEAGKVHARVLPGGAATRLTNAEAVQVTLALRGDALYAAWAEQAGRFKRIVVARLGLANDALNVKQAQPVEAAMPSDEQGWPALAVAGDGSVTVAWEDRRDRHTVPLVSHSRDGQTFAAPARLTDHKSRSVDGLGAGTGAMRPTLATWGEQGVAAVWLDKRDFLSGYDVYAAFDTGTRRFGKNLRVQDSFGDNMAQWHAQIVGDASGRLVALWDDARDGTPGRVARRLERRGVRRQRGGAGGVRTRCADRSGGHAGCCRKFARGVARPRRENRYAYPLCARCAALKGVSSAKNAKGRVLRG